MAFALALVAIMAPMRGDAQSCATCSSNTCEKWEITIWNSDAYLSEVKIGTAWTSGVVFGLPAVFSGDEIDKTFSAMAGEYLISVGGIGLELDGVTSRPAQTWVSIKRTGGDGVISEWFFMNQNENLEYPAHFPMVVSVQASSQLENSTPGASSSPQMDPAPVADTPAGTQPDLTSAPLASSFSQQFSMGENETGQAGYIDVNVDLVGRTVTAGCVTFDLAGTTDTEIGGTRTIKIPTMDGDATCEIITSPTGASISFSKESTIGPPVALADHLYVFDGENLNGEILNVTSHVGTEDSTWSVNRVETDYQVGGVSTGVRLGDMSWSVGDDRTEITSLGVHEPGQSKVGREVTEKRFKRTAGNWKLVSEEVRLEMGQYQALGGVLSSSYRTVSRKVTTLEGIEQMTDYSYGSGTTTAATVTKAEQGGVTHYQERSVRSEATVAGNKQVTESRELWGTQTGGWLPAGGVTHAYLGDDIILSTAEDGSILYSRNPGTGPLTETDATGITRSKDFDAAGKLLNETKKGVVGATNPGVAADVTTSYVTTPTIEGGELTTVQVSAGTATRTESVSETDAKGWVVRTVDALGRETRSVRSDGGRTVTETLPGGLTRVTKRYLDGQLKSISGTAVVPEYHVYAVNDGTAAEYEAGSITETVYFNDDGTGEARSETWRRTTTNALGQTLREEEPAPVAGGAVKVTTHTYNDKGQRVSTQTAGLAALRFEYDVFGRLKRQGYDVDENEVLGTGTDPTTETVVEYLASGGVWHEVTKQRRFVSGGPPEETQHWRKLTEGPLSFEKVVSPDGARTQTAVTVDRTLKRVAETRSFFRSSTGGVAAVSTRTFINGLLVGETLADVSVPIVYVHNGFGQVTGMSHPQAGTMERQYFISTGQLDFERSAAQGRVTYAYYAADEVSAGRIKSVTRTTVDEATTVVTRQAYNALGQMTHQWGSAAQPIRHLYDDLGRLKEMRTYKDGTGWDAETPAGFEGTDNYAATKWAYHPGTDALSTKTDAYDHAVEYVYDGAGLLTARKWARAVTGGERLTTSYSYQQTPGGLAVPGRVTGISYNDGLTPAVTITYGRAFPSQVTDAAGTRVFSNMNSFGGGTEKILQGNGLLDGLFTARTMSQGGGQRALFASMSNLSGDAIVNQTMSVAANGLTAAVSDHLAEGGGTQTHTFERSGVTGRLERVKRGLYTVRQWQYDEAGRLRWVGNGLVGVTYEHRADGRRSAATPFYAVAVDAPPPAGWAYQYNGRGEVNRASRYVPFASHLGSEGATPVANQTRGYAYDNMGNRKAATRGPPPEPADTTHTISYTPNALNQYDTISHVRHAEISGQTAAGAAVSFKINGLEIPAIVRSQPQHQTADPNGWRYEATVNGTDAQWLDVEVRAAMNGNSQVKRGWIYVPPAAEAPAYDQDGNLTGDSRWTYTWDGENHLIAMEEKSVATAAVAGSHPPLPKRRKLTFAYDYRHRRIAKTVEEYQLGAGNQEPGTWVMTKDLRFVYDDWNLIAELDHTPVSGPGLAGSAVVRRYVWGVDLAGQSGSSFPLAASAWQGAGGVGGLLSVKHQGVTYHPCYDGNGNIIGLQAGDGAQAGQIVARYDYDPFGNRITDTGPGVELCPFGFSTKYRDEETGMLYYGFRYYSPETGRWPSRDPIGERGGINLYGMVGNDPVGKVEYLGYTALDNALHYMYPGLFDKPGHYSNSVWGAAFGSEDFKGYLTYLKSWSNTKAKPGSITTTTGKGLKAHFKLQDSPNQSTLAWWESALAAGGIDLEITKGHEIKIDCRIVMPKQCICKASSTLYVYLSDNYQFGNYFDPINHNSAAKWVTGALSLGGAHDYMMSDYRTFQWTYEFTPK